MNKYRYRFLSVNDNPTVISDNNERDFKNV